MTSLSPWMRETPLGQCLCFLLRYPSRYDGEDSSGGDCEDHSPGGKPEAAIAPVKNLPHPRHEIIISWDGPDDPRHPRNWSSGGKGIAIFIISYVLLWFLRSIMALLTMAINQAIFLRGLLISQETASLVMSLYVIGYGTGPLLFSPLSEVPQIGRNPPYILSFVIFVIISVILGFVDNFPAMAVLRFFQGVFGSPCLATAGASIHDLYSEPMASYAVAIWVFCLFSGPALGPVFSSHAVLEHWRWPFWQIFCMSGPCLILMLCLLPETSSDTLLLRRARRARRCIPKDGGNWSIAVPHVRQQQQIEDRHLLSDALVKPLEITVKDPAVAFTCMYASFTYAIYYSFFEVFPLVYRGVYQMSLFNFSLSFLAIVVAATLGILVYLIYLSHTFHKHPGDYKSHESVFTPALPAAFFLPIGLFVFACTARVDIHWMVPTCGIVIYSGSLFIVYQTILVYIPRSYPRYAASLFAANDFARSLTAAAFIMATPYMYAHLGIRNGVILLASISVLGIPLMMVLYWYGKTMRGRSKFTDTASNLP
ncbi:hypothetical protein FE257_008564 [Aspergillus nanangensis]|uniref:Major facilitator superfamily (MFS) profile domain-containing protein n=1 Tax=Aspergillus nanangensis TaxID=2582783 RepID=A0AAD4CLD3_ASPNN|nr:hypothetical protein FE257_008564 [Aspergillus nanangensis]